MDGQAHSISSQQLYQHLGTASAPILVDVRRQDAFGNDDRLIIGALYRSPEEVERWRNEFSASRPIIAYCSHGREVSQGVAEALRRAGVEARYLEGGIGGWKELRLPTRRKRDASESKWVTREHPKIDRIACPWLISRFVKPDAEFIYVPPNEVANTAASIGGTPMTSKGSSSDTLANAARSMRLYALMTSTIRHSTGWRRLYVVPTPRDPISRRNARGCSRSLTDCRQISQTITKC
jgi:rhodanese-related sulfurtransferase